MLDCDELCTEQVAQFDVALEFDPIVFSPEYVNRDEFKAHVGETAKSLAEDIFDDMYKQYKDCGC